MKGDDGSIDYAASAASVPALVAAGVTDVRYTVAVPEDSDRAVEVLVTARQGVPRRHAVMHQRRLIGRKATVRYAAA